MVISRCLRTGDLSRSWVSSSRFFSLPSFQIARITVRVALAIGLAESRIELLVADTAFSFEEVAVRIVGPGGTTTVGQL